MSRRHGCQICIYTMSRFTYVALWCHTHTHTRTEQMVHSMHCGMERSMNSAATGLQWMFNFLRHSSVRTPYIFHSLPSFTTQYPYLHIYTCRLVYIVCVWVWRYLDDCPRQRRNKCVAAAKVQFDAIYRNLQRGKICGADDGHDDDVVYASHVATKANALSFNDYIVTLTQLDKEKMCIALLHRFHSIVVYIERHTTQTQIHKYTKCARLRRDEH